jgi:hypothetical protein
VTTLPPWSTLYPSQGSWDLTIMDRPLSERNLELTSGP